MVILISKKRGRMETQAQRLLRCAAVVVLDSSASTLTLYSKGARSYRTIRYGHPHFRVVLAEITRSSRWFGGRVDRCRSSFSKKRGVK